jgi:serine/threonine protein kinase
MKNKEESVLTLDIKKAENKINSYIDKELKDKDLPLEYLKIKNKKKLIDKENEFFKKFDLLYNYMKNKLDKENEKNNEKTFYKNIIKIFPKDKVINLKKCEDNKELIDKIKVNYNIEKIIKENDDSYDSKLFIINIKDKKYFLKIYRETSYEIEDNIKNFIQECKRLKDASEKKLSPKIYDSFIYICNKKNKYYNKEYYWSKKNYNVIIKVLITEYIEGVNFEEYMNTEKFIPKDIENIKNLMKELHNIGIFHGNITPRNIIYNKNYKDGDYKFKFVDFSASDTCETISKYSLNRNIKSIEQLGINYSDKEYLKIYIAIYELLDKNIIKIIL